MKLSLRNLAMGAALAVSSLAFAQEMPFTITETFSTVLTKDNGGIDAANIRGGVAFNNAVYMLDKSTGTIYKWDAEGKTEYRTGLNTSALSPSITVDYAGNILVSYGWSGALTGFGIVPADGSDVIYINELPTIENWAPGRKDVLGRVAGDMLSEEGAYLFLPGTGTAYCAYYYFSKGEIFAPESGYASSPYDISCNNLDVAVPAASTVAEIEELDPLYDAAYLFPWSSSAQYIVSEEYQTLGRPADLSYSNVAGGDLFTFDGKTYFVSPYTQVETKRTGDFVIFDEDLNIIYKSQNANPDVTAAGAFPNGGSIIVRPIDDYTFELGVAEGTASGFFCSTYTIAFPKPEPDPEPELPFTITETFSTVLTKDNGGIDAANIRGGVAFNNAVYMLDKSTGTIYKWDAEGKTEYRTGLNTSALSPSITVDYAGNILVSYGWSGALTGFGIVPADGSDVIYINELPTIENWAPGRKDVLGRVAGDMLSEEGAYLFLPGTGTAYCAYYYFSKGEIFAPESGYASSPYDISCNNLDVAVPAASTVAEIEELDPLYDAAYLFPWSSSAQYIVSEEYQTLGRPADLSYSNVAGGDLFTFDGKTYFVSPYTQVETKRTGDFVIFDEDLNIIYKSQNANPDVTAAGAFPNGGSIIVRPIDDYTFELGVAEGTASGFFCSTHTIAFPKPEPDPEPVYADRNHFAYDLDVEDNGAALYTIKFKSTGDAPKAVLEVYEEGSEEAIDEVELGAVVKGENTFSYDATELASELNYNWAIRIHNYEVPENIISEPIAVGGGRAGLAVFTDPEYPEVFGKVAIGRTSNGGIDVYNAEGSLEVSAAHAGNNLISASGNANSSSPMDGKARGTDAVFASWGDSSYGVVAFNIADIEAEPYSVFEGVKESNGTIMNNGVATGSGTPCVAFQGKGDETLMFTFDEDIFGNQLAVSRIGANKTVGTALEVVGFKSLLANTNIGMWGVENGLFLTQVRTNGMEAGTPGLAYYDVKANDVTWNISQMASVDEAFLPSAAAGVCVNPEGDLLAVSTYTGVEVYILAWCDNLPVLEKYRSIVSPYATTTRTNIQFDAANNIHVTNQANGYYRITLANEEPIVLTAAKSDKLLKGGTVGVEDIAIDAANTNVVYYNLNGIRVAAEDLTPGIYVKVVGTTATKVVVK